jgi:tRNA(fMet)-specific endonuclease VapC
MLDTNICIYVIKNKPSWVKEKFSSLSPIDLCISSITTSELLYGAEKSKYPAKNKEALERFLSPLNIVDYGYKASLAYGKIRTFLEKTGNIIGSMDLLIAAHALSLNVTIITNNEKEFKKVKDLKVENWY